MYCNSSANQAFAALSSGMMLPSVEVDGDITTTTITGLTAFTSYDCHVTATTFAGEGNASNVATETTAEAGSYMCS